MPGKQDNDRENTLIFHLEELRKMLLRCLVVTALLYPAGYWASPYVIRFLVRYAFPPEHGQLYYFMPLEVFWTELKLALVLALVLAYPWNIRQIWRFVAPALYENEKKTILTWLAMSSVLFFGGVAFCVGAILPMLMTFSGGFAAAEIQPMIGLAHFLNLAGWLSLAFGLMFQTPVLVMLAVRCGVISADSLGRKRPYVMTVILIVAAVLTPPDIVSQLMMALPSWLLFELGLLFARKIENQRSIPKEV